MFSKDIGIDLGTANVLLYVKKEGVVLNEPSVVALPSETRKILAVGSESKEMLGRTPVKINAIKPMKEGVIADFEITEIMLSEFIKKCKAKNFINKPKILICCPSNITQVEKNAIKEAAEKAGAKKVYLEEEPKVAAIGAGMDIFHCCSGRCDRKSAYIYCCGGRKGKAWKLGTSCKRRRSIYTFFDNKSKNINNHII